MTEDRFFPDLDTVLYAVSDRMKELGVPNAFSYEFGTSHIILNKEPVLTRPTYCLDLKLNGSVISKTHYELDTRFGLELAEFEVERVEDLLVDRCIGSLVFNGVQTLVAFVKSGITPQSVIKESEDKGNLRRNVN